MTQLLSNEEEDINKPDLYFTFTPEGWKSPTTVVIEIEKLLNNEWYIPSYVGNYSKNDVEYIQDKGRELKERLDNTPGETPAEKFFNMVLGVKHLMSMEFLKDLRLYIFRNISGRYSAVLDHHLKRFKPCGIKYITSGFR